MSEPIRWIDKETLECHYCGKRFHVTDSLRNIFKSTQEFGIYREHVQTCVERKRDTNVVSLEENLS